MIKPTTACLTLFCTTLALPALADCAPDTNGTVVCSGVDADGYVDGAQGTTVVIEDGAVVNPTAGFSLVLGAGEDQVLSEGTLNGSADFGADEDLFEIYGSEYSSIFGGSGSIFDGGSGYDIVDFKDIMFDDVSVAAIANGFNLTILNSIGGTFDIALTNWEEFAFVGGRGIFVLTAEEIADFVPAAVPLPAGALLMLTGLGGLVAMRRRQS